MVYFSFLPHLGANTVDKQVSDDPVWLPFPYHFIPLVDHTFLLAVLLNPLSFFTPLLLVSILFSFC